MIIMILIISQIIILIVVDVLATNINITTTSSTCHPLGSEILNDVVIVGGV